MPAAPVKPSFAAIAASGLPAKTNSPPPKVKPAQQSAVGGSGSGGSTTIATTTTPQTTATATTTTTTTTTAPVVFQPINGFNGPAVSSHLTAVFKQAVNDKTSQIFNGDATSGGGWKGNSSATNRKGGAGMGDKVLVELKKGRDRLARNE